MSKLIKCDICGTTLSEEATCFSKWHKVTVTSFPPNMIFVTNVKRNSIGFLKRKGRNRNDFGVDQHLKIHTIEYDFCDECKKKFDQFLKEEGEKQK